MAGVIYLDIDDEITSAATRIRDAKDARVALVLPAGSRVATSRINFRLLAREAQSRHRQLSIVGRSPERRRASRVDVVFPVRILQYHGVECQGWAEDLSPFGMKVKTDAALRAGEAVKVSFTLPDGGPPVRVNSLVLRIDRSGHAFYFVNLTAQDFERLGEFSRRHLTL